MITEFFVVDLSLLFFFFVLLIEVTIIPTYDSDVLGYWVAENEEALMENRIDLAPSASRCTGPLELATFWAAGLR